MSLISNESYSSSWLLPEILARITIKVTEIKKAENLPHLNESSLWWKRVVWEETCSSKNLPLTSLPRVSTQQVHQGWQGKKSLSLSKPAWFVGQLQSLKPQRRMLSCWRLPKTNIQTNWNIQWNLMQTQKLLSQTKRMSVSQLHAALSTFKASKRKWMALSARFGIKDRRQRHEDSNRFKDLIASHRGYRFSARVLTRILRMYRAAGSRSTHCPLWNVS